MNPSCAIREANMECKSDVWEKISIGQAPPAHLHSISGMSLASAGVSMFNGSSPSAQASHQRLQTLLASATSFVASGLVGYQLFYGATIFHRKKNHRSEKSPKLMDFKGF